MKLKNRYNNSKCIDLGVYDCFLTELLDSYADIRKTFGYRHYILADYSSLKEKILPIRVPGGTVGNIWIDDNNIITKIKIDTNYVIKTYPENINELVEKFVGEKIELES